MFLKKWLHSRRSHGNIKMAIVSHLTFDCEMLVLSVGLFLCVDALVGLDT